MRLEFEPVWRHVAAEGALSAVAGGMAAAVHVEQCTVAKHRTARAHKRSLPLAEICQYLLVREIRQQVSEMSVGTKPAATSSVRHRCRRYLPEDEHTHQDKLSQYLCQNTLAVP